MKRSRVAGRVYLSSMAFVVIPLVLAIVSFRPYVLEYVSVAVGGGFLLLVSGVQALDEKYAGVPVPGVEGDVTDLPLNPDLISISWIHLSPRAFGVIACGVIIALSFFVPWYYFFPLHWYLDPLGMSAPYPLPDMLSVVLWVVAAILALAGAIIFKWTPPTD